ncbi:PAXNEB-domain-containing protein [Hyaloscypha hepaticicola]|uniref:Elongator complex protein 4 n=1 Tax=Hyaloscypha hepaticicola TaxID=2082293 RepID=A0A2J6PRA5_9HELO|nr:PAXNEB-domain-containing protein [Hyaloscypha hepaticicola]
MASFRKRNVPLRSGTSALSESPTSIKQELAQGVRPSPLDGRLTTSTGTRSLDGLLAGHAGLALGTSLLVEESGTTDFGGSLLKYYASEGVVQGHHVHVLGMNEGWGRDLPGVVETSKSARKEGNSSGDGVHDRDTSRKSSDGGSGEKMKIAWRYERLGEFGSGSRDRNSSQSTGPSTSNSGAIFCHDFDLSKRLILPSPSLMYFVPSTSKPDFEFTDANNSASPFNTFLNHLITHLSASASNTVHRIIIPNLLSPALHTSELSRPESVLQFLHALRALLRKYSAQVTAMITLPLTLYPRSTGLTRWMELLSDGVLELAPFPSSAIATKSTPGASTIQEEPPQGMLKIHRLPIFHEKGGGGGEASGFGDDLAFTLSRRKGVVIKPFSLPPVEGDSEAQQGGLEHDHGKATKVDIEF